MVAAVKHLHVSTSGGSGQASACFTKWWQQSSICLFQQVVAAVKHLHVSTSGGSGQASASFIQQSSIHMLHACS
eukprot:1142938-Pelagomonas_calceolata.AAC.1